MEVKDSSHASRIVTPKPTPLPVLVENIPDGMKAIPQWVDWRYTWNEDKEKWDKPLFQPNGWNASSTAKHTWSSLTATVAAYKTGKYDGIGFVMKKSDTSLQIIGFDFDKCRDPITGKIDPKIIGHLDKLNTYSEISPSGTGIRAFAKEIYLRMVEGKKES